MAITPSSISFNYKQGEALPPTRVVYYSHQYNNTVFEDVPNWLSVWNNQNTSADVLLSTPAQNLVPGNYSAVVTVKGQQLQEDGNGNLLLDPNAPTYTVGTFTVSLVVQETIVLSVSPEQLSYNYQLGGNAPADQTVTITCENNWTVTENSNWLSVSATSGSNNGSFQVTVVPSGLPIGTHTTDITVDDGVTTVVIPVTLIVSEPDTGSDYLYVTPVVLNFGYTVSGVIPPLKRVELNSSGNWTATANKTWISLSAASGVAGAGYVDIGLQNLAGLTVGNHFATVTIVNASIVKTVNITLSVFEYVEELLDENTLYYTDESNLITVSSGRTDTHLQIQVATVYEGVPYDILYNNPFFKGKAEKRIGAEAKKIIGERPFIGLSAAAIFNPYKPALLNFTVNEVEMFTSQIAQSVNLQNISFTKGVTPVNGWMSDLPNTVFCTKNGRVHFSFVGKTFVPVDELKVTGATTKTYAFSNEIEKYYTAVLPLNDLNLEVGDEIKVEAGDASINVVIKPEDKEQSFIFWENQWGFWDVVEFTGEFISTADFKETSFEYRKDFKTTETKVLEVKDKVSYKISTGWVYSNEEVATLRKMLNATNMYLYKGNTLVKVKSNNKKLELEKTNEFLKSFSLTFENVVS